MILISAISQKSFYLQVILFVFNNRHNSNVHKFTGVGTGKNGIK